VKKAEIQFKDDSIRITSDYADLSNHNGPLRELIVDVSEYVFSEYKKNITITMIYRTQAEQEGIYGVGYAKKSPHQFWQAIDLRSKVFTTEEIDDIVEYINNGYNKSNYYKWSAKNHEVNGHGTHFHIQYLEV